MSNPRSSKIQHIQEGEAQVEKFLFPLQRAIAQEGQEKSQLVESLGYEKWEVTIDC